ncbi:MULTISPECIES: helix-turn-helix domain-containing protein [Streptococcus]|uniref:Transposase n=1 Tax=Streptococcus caledonicus TaxID=2614158 RepID=A0ABW0UHK5_9STRE|nr:helix-turn-helix domain-containing protein [Streptococcus sp. S784/96/1]
MSKRIPKSVEEKLEIVNLYLEKGKSISSLIREYGVSDTTIRTWVRKYQQLGIAGLRESNTWTRKSIHFTGILDSNAPISDATL